VIAERRAVLRALEQAPTAGDGLCRCGCGRPTNPARSTDTKRGHVAGKPMAYLAGHGRKQRYTYRIDADSGCWLWQGPTDRLGYGRMKIDGHNHLAHRYFFEQAHGPIPPGLDLHHRCETPPCVNPSHLDPLARRAHVLLGRRARLTEHDVAAIRALAGTITQQEISERFGVTRSHVSCIIRRKTWT